MSLIFLHLGCLLPDCTVVIRLDVQALHHVVRLVDQPEEFAAPVESLRLKSPLAYVKGTENRSN
jgi:hypothetical protein